MVAGGPPAFGDKDREAFANQLDRFLAKSSAAARRAAGIAAGPRIC
jgi:uncharacterized protein YaiI (UPF0178 family)